MAPTGIYYALGMGAVPDARSNDPEMESCSITKQRLSPHTHKVRSLHTHRWPDKTDSGSSWQSPFPAHAQMS